MLFRWAERHGSAIVLITEGENAVKVERAGDRLFIRHYPLPTKSKTLLCHELGYRTVKRIEFAYPLNGQDQVLNPFEQELGRECLKALKYVR